MINSTQTPARMRMKGMIVTLAIAATVAVVLGVSQRNTSIFQGSVSSKKELKMVDLSVVWSVPSSISSSQDIVQTVDLGNEGPGNVKKVSLKEPLIPGATFVSATASDPITKVRCEPKGKKELSCEVQPAREELVPGGHVTVMLTFSTRSKQSPLPCDKTFVSGELVGSIDGENLADRNPENNRTSQVSTVVDCSDITTDLSVNTQAMPTPMTPSETLEYYVNVVNNGPAKAKGAKVRHQYPQGFHFVRSSTTQCTDDVAQRTVTCLPGYDDATQSSVLEPGQNAQIELQFSTDPNLSHCSFAESRSSMVLPPDGLIDLNSDNNVHDLSVEIACP